MNILFIKLGELGGVLRATPFFKGIKEKYPDAKLHFLTKKDSKELLLYNPDIDNLWFLEDKDKLREIDFDWIINTEDDPETCSFVTELKTKKLTGPFKNSEGKISYSQDSAIWYDTGKISKWGLQKANELKKQSKRSYQDIYCEILGLPRKDYSMILNLTESEKIASINFLKKNNLSSESIIVGINTGAGTNWPLKSISVEKTVELIKKLSEHGLKIVLLGGPNEKQRNQQIISSLDISIVDAGTNNSLREFMSIVNALDIIVTSDTLALHMAVALKKRVVSFFGPTSAEEIDLHNQGVKIKPTSECYCCFQKQRSKPQMCIDKITVEELVKETLDQVKFL